MAQRSLRFGVHDGAGRRAATWKLWTEIGSGRSEVYLACRSLGRVLKASLHESGRWHIAYSQEAFDKYLGGTNHSLKDRFIQKWPRSPEIAPGITLAFRIVTPWSAVTSTIKAKDMKSLTWLPKAPESKATEVDILITVPAIPVTGWPGKHSMGTSLVGEFPLENGETVWAVYHFVDMPDLSGFGQGAFRFYRGRSKKDLIGHELRAHVVTMEPDGSRVIYDCAVQSGTSKN